MLTGTKEQGLNKDSTMYAAGYEDGWAGRDFDPEFINSREYGNGWREGRKLYEASQESQ